MMLRHWVATVFCAVGGVMLLSGPVMAAENAPYVAPRIYVLDNDVQPTARGQAVRATDGTVVVPSRLQNGRNFAAPGVVAAPPISVVTSPAATLSVPVAAPVSVPPIIPMPTRPMVQSSPVVQAVANIVPVAPSPVPPVAGVSMPVYTGCATQQGQGLDILAGDVIADKLVSWARSYGYDLFWDGGHYRAEGQLSLRRGFDDTLADVRDAMQQSGVNLNIKIYSNCVVRVVEVR